MPRYSYYCNFCGRTVETMHGIKEILTECTFCEKEDALVRVPAMVYTKTEPWNGEAAVGSIVERAIDDGREELKKEKEKLKTEFYEVPVKK